MTNETTKKQVLERAAQVIIETKVLVEKVMKVYHLSFLYIQKSLLSP